MLLIELTQEGFTNLLGVDFSEGAVKLANEILKDKRLTNFIRHKRVDLLSGDDIKELGKFKIVHDKGEFCFFVTVFSLTQQFQEHMTLSAFIQKIQNSRERPISPMSCSCSIPMEFSSSLHVIGPKKNWLTHSTENLYSTSTFPHQHLNLAEK